MIVYKVKRLMTIKTQETSYGLDQQDLTNNEPRRNKRARTSKSFGPDFLTYLLEPQNFKAAMTGPEAPCGKRLLIMKLHPLWKIILGNWWTFHQVLNLLDINGHSREK